MGRRQRRRERGQQHEQDEIPAVTVQAGLAQAESSVPGPDEDKD